MPRFEKKITNRITFGQLNPCIFLQTLILKTKTKMIKNLTFIFFACFLNLSLGYSQTFEMDGTPITGCEGFFTDSGGNAGGYGPNENFTTTICSDGVNGTHIQMIFANADILAGDNLCFFDGPDTNAPELACADEFIDGGSFIMQATAANTTGCLTLQFTSDGSGEGQGWSADINCIAACQLITSVLVNSTPSAVPLDNGYIDICPGDGIEFFGAGEYPQDGAVYNHSDQTSNFFWDFGDGTMAQGPTVYKVYDTPGGYTVQLTIIDQFGCENTNFLSQRVRVSTYPTYAIDDQIPDIVCSGDTLILTAADLTQDSTAELSVGSTTGSFQNTGARSDSIALPDGVGVAYSTSISFSDFAPGQILTDINDFLGVCITMEHSWMFDLDVFLSCPDGTEVHMQVQEFIGQEVYLGQPIDGDGDPPVQGVGAQYCFVPGAASTWTDFAVNNGVQTLPPGDYLPANPFDAFLGCPLNGEWTLTIWDQWGGDNGFVFNWNIGFDQSLFPDLETFTPEIVDLSWVNQDNIVYYENDSIVAAPQAAGAASYRLEVTDNFGCTNDTTVEVNVLPVTHPDCYNCGEAATFMKDTTACNGGSVTISAIPPDTIAPPNVSFAAFPYEELEFVLYPPALPFESNVEVDYVYPDGITDGEAQIESVCVNIDHKYDADVEIFLRSPAGTIIELSTNNGGSANDYINTCFTASAPASITTGSPPFTGEWQPEESFNAFNGEDIDGTWTLLVSDASNGFRGEIKDWTITFDIKNGLSYNWEPNPDLSCTICPDPEVTPSSFPATYTVEITDDFGCIINDTIVITEAAGFDAPEVVCTPGGNTSVVFSWNDVGAMAYEVSINGVDWFPSDAVFSHTIDGLLVGETATLEVRAVPESDCESAIGTATCAALECMLMIDTISTQRPACTGDTNGGAIMTAAGGVEPYEFFVNGDGPFTDNITGLSAGIQEIVVVDVVGCRDTIEFELTSISTPMFLTMSQDSVNCFDGTDGTAIATAAGGFGTFDYEWNTVPVQTNLDATALPIGTYTVTVTDQAGCSLVDSVTVLQPDSLALELTTTDISCNGANDGTGIMLATGGVPDNTGDYTYSWSSGGMGATVNDLLPGAGTGTVVDVNGCSATVDFDILEPMALSINLDPTNLTCFENNSGIVTPTVNNAIGAATYVWTGPNSFSSSLESPNNLAIGEYCVTVTDANNCTVSDCITLTQPVEIALSESSTPAECFNDPSGTATVLANGGSGTYQYLWSDDNNQTSDIATGLTAGNYTVTVTDGNMCTSTIDVTVGAASEIVLQLSSTPPMCSNSTDGDATVTASGGQGNLTYLWDTQTGDQTTAVANSLGTGTYCVTVTDENNCTATNCVEVMPVSPLEVLNVVPTMATCYGAATGQALVDASGGTGTYGYLWSDNAAQTTNPATGLEAGTYTVIITDQNGCTESTDVVVGQPDTLTTTITSLDVDCFGGNTGTATAVPVGGTGDYQYSWNNGQTTVDAIDLAAGVYDLVVTDENGCTSIASTEISQPATGMDIAIFQQDTACFEASTSAAFVTVTGGTPASGSYTYEWSGNAGTDSIATNLMAENYQVTITDANGCTESIDLTMQEFGMITMNVARDEPDCFGDSNGMLTVSEIFKGGQSESVNDYDYNWSTGGTGQSISNLSGKENYQVTAVDANGCEGMEDTYLDGPNQIVLNIESTDPSCFEDENGIVNIFNVDGNNPNHTYAWSANANGATTSKIENVGAGTYRVTVTDDLGCTQDSLVVLTHPDELTARFEVTPSGCATDSIGTIFTEILGGTPAYTYEWSNGDNTGSIDNLPTGNFSVIIRDAQGCEYMDTLFVGSPDPMVADLTMDDPDCVGGRDGRLEVAMTGGVGPFEYRLNGGEFMGSSTLIALEAGFYTLEVKDQTSCRLIDTFTLIDPPAFTVDAGADVDIISGDSVQLNPEYINNIGAVQLSWTADFDGTLSCVIDTLPCDDPWVHTFATNTYELYGVDENGCDDTDEITITIIKPNQIFVPTAFTPNADGSNDLLNVHGVEGATVLNFAVFDRWGSKVFQAGGFEINERAIGWNGTYRGKSSPSGVYTWMAEVRLIDGTTKQVSGHTTLLR